MWKPEEYGTKHWMSGSLGRSAFIPCIMFSIGFAVVIFVAIGSLTWPLGNDQSHYGFVGDAILDGRVPYRDAWDLKGPLTYYIFACTRAILGRNEVSIRVFDLIVVSLFCRQLRRLVFHLNGRQTFGANFAVLFFLLSYFGGGQWFTAQPDDWGGMLILTVISLLLNHARNPYVTMAASGVIIALAILLKPTFVIFTPLIILYPERYRGQAFNSVKIFAVCILVMILVLVASYAVVFRKGGFYDLFDALRFAYSAYGSFGQRILPERIYNGALVLRELGLVIPYVLVLVALWAMRKLDYGSLARMLGAWFSLSIVMVVYQGAYWGDEFISATISAAVIIGVSLTHLDRWLKAPIMRYLGQGAVFLLIGITSLESSVSSSIFSALEWPGYVLGLKSRKEFVVQIGEPWDRRQELEELTEYVVTHTGPNDMIQIWGWDIRPLTLSGRKPASRFGTTWQTFTETPMQSTYRRVFMEDISRSVPCCILVDTSYSDGDSFLKTVREFPEFDKFLHAHYKLESRVGEFQVWTLEHSRASFGRN